MLLITFEVSGCSRLLVSRALIARAAMSAVALYGRSTGAARFELMAPVAPYCEWRQKAQAP